MRARHHQALVAGEELVKEQLRQRSQGKTLVERGFQLNVAARNGIAYNHEVRARLEVLLTERLRNGDAELSQKL